MGQLLILRYCRQGGVASKCNQHQALLVFTFKTLLLTKNVQVRVVDLTGRTSEKCDMDVFLSIAELQ